MNILSDDTDTDSGGYDFSWILSSANLLLSKLSEHSHKQSQKFYRYDLANLFSNTEHKRIMEVLEYFEDENSINTENKYKK